MNTVPQTTTSHRQSATKAVCAIFFLIFVASSATAGERTQNFDSDPKWQESNNHVNPKGKAIEVSQDFGYSTSKFAGDTPGEIGGLVARASKPAYYAARIPTKTLDDKLVASGTFAITQSSKGAIFFGFFKADQPGASGRPICSLGLNLGGERSGGRLAVRLINSKNRSCGTFVTPFIPGRFRPTPIRNDGTRYTWNLTYDPIAAGGNGQFTFTLHGEKPKPGALITPDMPESYKHEAQTRFPDTTSFTVDLPKGFKEEGATFDHFGMMNLTSPGGHMHVYLTDLQYLDQKADLSKDPHWDASGNRSTYQTDASTGAQNFGYSNTNFAGGEKPGEMGGTFWRTEGPVASYGDAVGPLTLGDKLVARGKISFLSGSPDSGMYVGWFNSKTVDQKDGLRDFVGVRIEGPTRVGHYFGPVAADDHATLGKFAHAPLLVPDQKPHDWSIEYDPKANGGKGTLVVHLDNESGTLNLRSPPHAASQLDRFGVFTPRVGGFQVKIFFDDLTYTAGQAEVDRASR